MFLLIVISISSRTGKEIFIWSKNNNTHQIKIGSHFHNNCGLALALAATTGCGGDTTFTGMGRGVKCQTELLANLSNKIIKFLVLTK